MKQRVLIAGTLIASFGLFSAGYLVRYISSDDKPAHTVSADSYDLLARRLFIEDPSDTRINFSELRNNLNDYFKENEITGSVYFEYLPTGTSIRVNADNRYQAASLIKLPVAMELYKTAELGKVDLDKKIALKEEWLNDGFGQLYQKGAGYELTLREAVRIMLVESDNTALRAILSVTESALDAKDRALASLDIEYDLEEDNSIEVGARSYSSFLKCLYFSCYNTWQDSQQILKYLTETPFNQRIVAGVDNESLVIAHKIGVFNTRVQSDCGIFYLDRSNYVLCVMLEGSDGPVTNATFVEISRIVYDFMKSY